jgi:hypothetical protein
MASWDAGMGFFQKVRKRINQSDDAISTFAPAITERRHTPSGERLYPAQTSVEEASQFDKTMISE